MEMENEKKDTGLEEIEALIKNSQDKRSHIDSLTEFVDLDKIKFEKVSIADQQEAVANIFTNKPSYQVVCAQSGYMAKLSPLVYRDIVAITNSTLSSLESKKAIYSTLYSKIVGYSVDKWKPTYDQWLEMTSLGDVETLFYGLYCATFQDESTIRFDCPGCEETNIVKIKNKQLIRVEDRAEMLELTTRISKEADTKEKVKEFSLVTKTKENMKSVRLPESKIIMTLKLPSLAKVLDVLKTYDDSVLAAKTVDAINILLAVESVAIPNSDGESYSYVEEKQDFAGLLDILGVDDFSVLNDVVSKLFESKHISYCLDGQKCQHCKKEYSHIPLDMENLLFFQISERQLS